MLTNYSFIDKINCLRLSIPNNSCDLSPLSACILVGLCGKCIDDYSNGGRLHGQFCTEFCASFQPQTIVITHRKLVDNSHILYYIASINTKREKGTHRLTLSMR